MDDIEDCLTLETFYRNSRKTKGTGLFFRRPNGSSGKHFIFYHCMRVSSCITVKIGSYYVPVMPFKTKHNPRTYQYLIAPSQTLAPIEGNWEALAINPNFQECEHISRSPYWATVNSAALPDQPDLPDDDEIFPMAPPNLECNSNASTEESPQSPVPLSPLIFISNASAPRPVPLSPLVFISNANATPETTSAPRNILDLLPIPASTSITTNKDIQALSKLIADYNTIHDARQRHSLQLADGKPPFLPLPKPFQIPAMHRIASPELVLSLNQTMESCAETLTIHLIEAEEGALKQILAEVTHIMADWTPTEEEFKSVVEFKNLRMKNQAKFRENGGNLEFFELIEKNGRPFIRPTTAPSTLHTTGQRSPKQTTPTADPRMVAEVLPHHPVSKAAKRRSRKATLEMENTPSPAILSENGTTLHRVVEKDGGSLSSQRQSLHEHVTATNSSSKNVRFSAPKRNPHRGRQTPSDYRQTSPRRNPHGARQLSSDSGQRSPSPRRNPHRARQLSSGSGQRSSTPRRNPYGSRQHSPDYGRRQISPRRNPYRGRQPSSDYRQRLSTPTRDPYRGRQPSPDHRQPYSPYQRRLY